MKKMIVLLTALSAALVLLSGCGGGTTSGNVNTQSTDIAGNWSITLTPTNYAPSTANIVVTVVPSSCSIQVPPITNGNAAPESTYTLSGPSCFLADSFINQGQIAGAGINDGNMQNGAVDSAQGVLLGVSQNPATNGSTVTFVYVEWYGWGINNGDAIVLEGSGTASNGSMSGTWTSQFNCDGCTGTFTGKRN